MFKPRVRVFLPSGRLVGLLIILLLGLLVGLLIALLGLGVMLLVVLLRISLLLIALPIGLLISLSLLVRGIGLLLLVIALLVVLLSLVSAISGIVLLIFCGLIVEFFVTVACQPAVYLAKALFHVGEKAHCFLPNQGNFPVLRLHQSIIVKKRLFGKFYGLFKGSDIQTLDQIALLYGLNLRLRRVL